MQTLTHSRIRRHPQDLIAHHRRRYPLMQGANLTIDETKFLGGDVEHTHLVKGLDYALLQKASWWFRSFRHRAHAHAFGMCSGSHMGMLQSYCTQSMSSCIKHGCAEPSTSMQVRTEESSKEAQEAEEARARAKLLKTKQVGHSRIPGSNQHIHVNYAGRHCGRVPCCMATHCSSNCSRPLAHGQAAAMLAWMVSGALPSCAAVQDGDGPQRV